MKGFVISFLAKRPKSGFSIFKINNIYNKREFKMMLYLHLIKTLKSFGISITYCKYNTPIKWTEMCHSSVQTQTLLKFLFPTSTQSSMRTKEKSSCADELCRNQNWDHKIARSNHGFTTTVIYKKQRSFSILLVKKYKGPNILVFLFFELKNISNKTFS